MYAVRVETNVNPSTKHLHITISEMDTPLKGTQMQSIRVCGTPRRIIAPLESHKIICTHEGHI